MFLYYQDKSQKGAALLPLHPLCSFNNIENVKCSILPKAQTARSVAALARIEVINRCLLASGRLFRLPASGAPSARSSVNACQPLRGFPPPPSAWLRLRYAITPDGVRGARQSSQSQPGLLCQRLPARAPQVGCAHPCRGTAIVSPHWSREQKRYFV